jgi:hypothetical protein
LDQYWRSCACWKNATWGLLGRISTNESFFCHYRENGMVTAGNRLNAWGLSPKWGQSLRQWVATKKKTLPWVMMTLYCVVGFTVIISLIAFLQYQHSSPGH